MTYSGAVAISCESDLSISLKLPDTRIDVNGEECEVDLVERVPTPAIANGSVNVNFLVFVEETHSHLTTCFLF